jgi:outer membrane immunogenic protein
VGYLIAPSVLTYLSGGFTEARFTGAKLLFSSVPPQATDVHVLGHTYSGWFLGSGFEYNLGWLPGLFWRTEYRYAQYDKGSLPFLLNSSGAPTGGRLDSEKFVQTIRSELVWRWNLDGPARTSPAMAVDLPRKAPPAPLVYNWTGCYMMGGGGYGMWTQDTSTFFDPDPSQVGSEVRTGGRGWFGTVGGGCDLQINDRWVVGAYGDYDFASIKGNIFASEAGAAKIGSEKLRSAWFVGGRIGYLIAPSVLTYFSGGFTEARFTGAELFFSSVPLEDTNTHVLGQTYSGWFLGSGLEYNLAWLPGLFWRTEYRYAQYDNESLIVFSTPAGTPTGRRLDSEKFVQTIRTELVWKLNWGGPVAARY